MVLAVLSHYQKSKFFFKGLLVNINCNFYTFTKEIFLKKIVQVISNKFNKYYIIIPFVNWDCYGLCYGIINLVRTQNFPRN